MGIISTIFGLIFGAITAASTFINAKISRSSLNEESKERQLAVLAEIRQIISDDKTAKSLDYIHSANFSNDLECMAYYLEEGDIKKIGLRDYEKLLKRFKNKKYLNKYGERRKIIEKDRERIRKSYRKIQYLLDNLNRIGYLAEDEKNRKVVIDYFDTTTTIDIEETYDKIASIIKKTREEPKSENKYIYFSNLYNHVIENNTKKQKK